MIRPDNLTSMTDTGPLQEWHDPDRLNHCNRFHSGSRTNPVFIFTTSLSAASDLWRIEDMQSRAPRLPTIGVLAGWQVYEGYVHGFLDLVLRGIHAEAKNQGCNLLLACGLGHTSGQIRLQPAWPVISSQNDFVPVGPWNTDGLIAINPLITTERSQYIQQVIAEGHPVVFVGPGERERRLPLIMNQEYDRQLSIWYSMGTSALLSSPDTRTMVDADSILRLKAYRRRTGLWTGKRSPSDCAWLP
jgi:hypothetical protein